MPIREFLQDYPLYRKFAYDVPIGLDNLPKPTINMTCRVCNSMQTFRMTNDYYETAAYADFASAGETVRAQYICVGCSVHKITFFITLSEQCDWFMKVGQHPAWEIRGDSQVEKLLGKRRDYLRRGLVCESQGYGVGAFAYYRRIVEEIIDDLLLSIEGLLGEEEKRKYSDALAQSSKTRIAAEKIDLVKDLLPSILRPEGLNPLSALHTTLSEGLHASSDERCLELAATIRQVLVFLATQVAIATNATAAFTDNMRSLLDKKASGSPKLKSDSAK